MPGYNPIYLTALGYRCELVFDRYADGGRIAMRLIAPPDSEMPGEPIATCTVNIPEVIIPNERIVFIKNWSENTGLLNDLVKAGIVKLIGKLPAGWTEADVCELLVEPQL